MLDESQLEHVMLEVYAKAGVPFASPVPMFPCVHACVSLAFHQTLKPLAIFHTRPPKEEVAAALPWFDKGRREHMNT